MGLWGENWVLIAMTSVAFGERSTGLAGEMKRANSIAPVLPEIRSSLQIMQTKRRKSRGGGSHRETGHEPSIHRYGIVWNSGAVELAGMAGRCF